LVEDPRSETPTLGDHGTPTDKDNLIDLALSSLQSSLRHDSVHQGDGFSEQIIIQFLKL
jgi:hypothetical protein